MGFVSVQVQTGERQNRFWQPLGPLAGLALYRAWKSQTMAAERVPAYLHRQW
jgi:hypothetical protein